MSESAAPKLRNARACEACRASKSRCFFKDVEHNICQRCEQIGYPCVIRTKARPMRSRAVRPASISAKPPLHQDGNPEFSMDLPSVTAPNSIKDVKELHAHHHHVFGDDDTEITNAIPDEWPRLIEQRKLNLQQAEQLLEIFRRKSVNFPFVLIPEDATVPKMSRNSPFLLLAIFTAAASSDPTLRFQMDQEFRRILSAKVVVDGQKSLDFLQGLLIYLAWYPLYAKPKNNQAFMYVTLAISLAEDLGLDKDEIPNTDFSNIKLDGLVENGVFTQAAKRTYLGTYYLSSASVSIAQRLVAVPSSRFSSTKAQGVSNIANLSRLSMNFQKPNHMVYRNLMEADGQFFLDDEMQTEVAALIGIQRLLENIIVFHKNQTENPEDPMYNVSPDLNIQIFLDNLENWRKTTPLKIRSLPHIALEERFATLTIYAHQIGFLRRPYRTHLPAITLAALNTQHYLDSCLAAANGFFTYLLAIPESYYADFATLQWSLLVQATLILSRHTFLMAETRGWDAETARREVPLVMYLDALCYRFQGASKTPTATRCMDLLGIFKMVLASVKKSYERRVSALVATPVPPSIPAQVWRGKCPVLDPALKDCWDIESSFFDSSGTGSASWNAGSTPVVMEGQVDAGEGKGDEGSTGCPMGGAGAPVYFDVWNTMTCNWAEEEPVDGYS